MIEKMCFGGNRREFLFALLPSFCQEIRPSREKFYVPVRVGCWPLRARVDGNRSPSTSTPTKPTGTPPREIALSTWAAKIATVEFPTLTRRAQCVKSAPNVLMAKLTYELSEWRVGQFGCAGFSAGRRSFREDGPAPKGVRKTSRHQGLQVIDPVIRNQTIKGFDKQMILEDQILLLPSGRSMSVIGMLRQHPFLARILQSSLARWNRGTALSNDHSLATRRAVDIHRNVVLRCVRFHRGCGDWFGGCGSRL